jgi:hypothetical protein
MVCTQAVGLPAEAADELPDWHAIRLTSKRQTGKDYSGRETNAMAVKAGDLVRTSSGKIGSVVTIDTDRTVVVMFDDYGERYRLSDLTLIGPDGSASAETR